ncbi:hypothetical protein K1719_037978 [Acacia pycnantha]|nr:hypothetical protein K1719_037978 [Acacia pycnantha]
MELSKGKEVNMEENEKLHPGENLTRVAMTSHDGAASKSFAVVLRELKKRYKVDVVVILEPRISGIQATKVIKSRGFKYSVRVEAVGFAGGIWMVWNSEELSVEVLVQEEQFLHCRLKLGWKEMLFTAVYANPCEQQRQQTWNSLHSLAREIFEPWLVAGDFNEIKTPLEQKGGGRVSETRCKKFNEWIQNCSLLDLETSGPFFTWKGPKWEGLERVFKRLDRCLCNVRWFKTFEDAEVRVIPRVGSDHHPLLIKMVMDPARAGIRNFRYEVAWQMHGEFKEFLQCSWREEEDLNATLILLQQDLKQWNKDVFGRIESRKRRILNRLNGIQQSDGKRINFWKDHWVDVGCRLIDKTDVVVSDEDRVIKVKGKR